MSSDLPPTGPPSFGPPTGPPPSGPPPSTPPPAPAQSPWGPPSGPTYDSYAGQPELLESGSGGPIEPRPGTGGGGRRKGFIAGGALVGIGAVAAGGFFVYSSFFASGPQPAEALPASTVGYLSVDLDPSGKQKLEALDARRKFPACDRSTGLKADDDLREKFFDTVQRDGACAGLSYDDDIAPWLGDRLAVAAVDLGNKDDNGDPTVTPVVVVQVTDAERAADGLDTLSSCSSGEDATSSDDPSDSTDSSGEDFGGWSIEGDWAVIAETTDLATQVTDAAADAPLSDDEDFNTWTDAAGDDGILTAYAAPSAGTFLAQAFTDLTSLGGASYSCAASTSVVPDGSADGGSADGSVEGDPFAYSEEDCTSFESELGPDADAMQEQLTAAFDNFGGLAVKVRFHDGGLEVESAGDFTGDTSVLGGGSAGDVLASLPEDTAAAFGFALGEGWFDQVTTSLSAYGIDDNAIAEAEAATGLTLPDDIETLFGESAAISLGSDFSFEDTFDPADLPVGVKVKGDPDAIGGVLDKVLATPGTDPQLGDFIGRSTDDDYVVVGPSSDYRDALLGNGGLGDSGVFKDVVPHAEDAETVLYVNFDANDWLVKLVDGASDGDSDAVANAKPLSALGFSTWLDGDVAHGLFRITTD
ncbi:hypothetical protein BH11ACT8_BH11ACT8_25540 [soil metagenome]